MPPTPPSPGKKASGNPAKQAQIDLTVKQQREQQKLEKRAAHQKQLARRQRSTLVWWAVGGAAAIIVVALVVASFVFAPKPAAEYTAGGEGAQIDGVETFTNETTHVEGDVDYAQNPPAGGPHNAYWLNCGIYTEPQKNENAVHSLEHGAIWVTYDPAAVSDDELTALKEQLPSTYVILSPYEDLPSPIVLTGWNTQLQVDSATDDRIAPFFEEYWRSQDVPEPSALCTGAIDGPGKQ